MTKIVFNEDGGYTTVKINADGTQEILEDQAGPWADPKKPVTSRKSASTDKMPAKADFAPTKASTPPPAPKESTEEVAKVNDENTSQPQNDKHVYIMLDGATRIMDTRLHTWRHKERKSVKLETVIRELEEIRFLLLSEMGRTLDGKPVQPLFDSREKLYPLIQGSIIMRAGLECTHCGKEVVRKDRYCRHCGMMLSHPEIRTEAEKKHGQT